METLEKLLFYVLQILENPFWISGLSTNEEYTRRHDDDDGSDTGYLVVMIDREGDVRVKIDGCRPGHYLRFRTNAGGGHSLRVRNALMVLAEAIRLDNEKRPQQ